MKKVLSIFLSIIMVASLLLSLNIYAFANSAANPTKVQLNNKYSYYYTEDDWSDHWYSFTPSSTGYYDIYLDFNGKTSTDIGNSYINFYNEYDELDGSGYYAPNKSACFMVQELKAGKTYNFNAICYEENINTNFYISNHTHIIETDLYQADYYNGTGYSGYYSESCRLCDYSLYKEINAVSTIQFDTSSFIYVDNIKIPNIVIIDSSGTVLKKDTDYTLSITNFEKQLITITFKGYYSGSKTLCYGTIPKSTTITKMTAKSKEFTVKWKKINNITGYQIQYSTDKNFKKNNKTVTVKGNKSKNPSKTISKLKSKKIYYVRIRTYKIENDKKIYSSWSKLKSIKTK